MGVAAYGHKACEMKSDMEAIRCPVLLYMIFTQRIRALKI